MLAGGPGPAFAVNVTTGREPAAAVRVFAPVLVPNIHAPGVATPELSVTALARGTDPPPLATVNTTVTPETALPDWFRTITDGSTDSCCPTVPVSVVGETALMLAATTTGGGGGRVGPSPPPQDANRAAKPGAMSA